MLKKVLDFVGLSVGSWLGWTLGATVSIFTAFIVSAVGMGAGLYAVRRLTKSVL